MKNRGMDRRHPLPGGRGVDIFLREKEMKGKRERGRSGQRGLNVRENNKRQRHREGKRHRGTNRDGDRPTDECREGTTANLSAAVIYPRSEFKHGARVFPGFVFLHFPAPSCWMYVRQRN